MDERDDDDEPDNPRTHARTVSTVLRRSTPWRLQLCRFPCVGFRMPTSAMA
jgi:hypothetical protein